MTPVINHTRLHARSISLPKDRQQSSIAIREPNMLSRFTSTGSHLAWTQGPVSIMNGMDILCSVDSIDADVASEAVWRLLKPRLAGSDARAYYRFPVIRAAGNLPLTSF